MIKLFQKKTVKLTGYSFLEGGGMLGGSRAMKVSLAADGRSLCVATCREWHSAPIEVKRYVADGLLERMSDVCASFPVRNWTTQRKSPFFAHDAATSTYTYSFEDGVEIRLTDSKEMPKDWRAFHDQIQALIIDAEASGENLPVEKEDLPFYLADRDVEIVVVKVGKTGGKEEEKKC